MEMRTEAAVVPDVGCGVGGALRFTCFAADPTGSFLLMASATRERVAGDEDGKGGEGSRG